MITFEQDPDVVQWGLQLFDSDPYYNCGYGGTVTSDNLDYYHGQNFKEDHYDIDFCNIENDELIARALQEELSQLAVAEAPESPHGGEDNLQISVFEQDFLSQSMGNYYSGQESGQEEADDIQPSSLCSSPDKKSYYGEEWSYPVELTDEYALDVEVGKRLNQMVPVPHVPRINGEIPSVDEATLDHRRLLERLQVYDLVERKVQGDGNCQFRSLSDQIYLIPEHHEFVRQQIVNQLKSNREIYEGYVPMAYDEYLEKMSGSGEWGDHVTLQAAADLPFPLVVAYISNPKSWHLALCYGVKIFVITSFKDTCYIEILPNVQRSNRVIYLSFWAEVHYNSIYPSGDVPELETKKKKRGRMLRNKQQLESPNEYE